MIVVTTGDVGGKRITRQLGLVSGEGIISASVFRDFFAGIRNVAGNRAARYETELRKARDIALHKMLDEASSIGANAVIGVALAYESIHLGSGGGMLMISASGTAVVVED
jgi:uncharacterized protein YbjQ (UPF0145 family)